MLRVWCSKTGDYNHPRWWNEIFFYDKQKTIRNLIVDRDCKWNPIVIPHTTRSGGEVNNSRAIEECKQCVYGLRMALSKCKKDHTFKPI